MPTLDKKALDMYTLDNYSLGSFTADKHKLDGAQGGGGGEPATSLLHFNGTDGSTIFTDETGKTWTANGNAQLDTAQKKFGTASGLFDGTGDWIDTPANDDFNVGSGDFTIDFWLKVASAGGSYNVWGQRDSAGSASSTSLYFNYYAGRADLHFGSGSSLKWVDTAVVITDTNWHHIAIVRYGNVLTTYVDGNSVRTYDMTGLTINSSINKFTIGRGGERPDYYFNGWIDEFRFSKGIARWISSFTPPTKPYSK